MPGKKVALLAGIVFLVTAAAVFAVLAIIKNNETFSSTDTSILNKDTLAKLPKKSASSASLTRVSKDIAPPTNSWISGLALQDKPLAVFPMPLSFQSSDVGFQVGLPEVSSTSTVITGGHSPGVEATITGAEKFELTRFDKTSATLTYRQSTEPVGTVTIAQGSPYVFYRATNDSEITIENAGGGNLDGTLYSYEKNGKRYVVQGFDGVSLKVDGAKMTANIPAGGLVTFYALASNGAADELKKYAGNELTEVKVTNENKNDEVRTRFEYVTKNNQPTLVSVLPYQAVTEGEIALPSYQSIYGDMKTYVGSRFTTAVKQVAPENELDLSKLSNDERNLIREELKKDRNNIGVEPQDTYFAGKRLARIANLLSLSKQLNETEISTQLQTVLKQELTKRLDGSYLYYDTGLKGIAGQTAAFGSEDFNDHHFHYAYFIYAAGILGTYDKDFLREYSDEVNLLVADIASYETYDEFPVQRNYDPYSAHAWAAGLSPFQDGNNQESSSEAMNAWNAVAKWGELIDNRALQQTGVWMLSNEMATAQKAWLNVDTTTPYLKNYTSPVASLNFGGKRTYSTFFSDESNAKLGILLIPMSPFMESIAGNGAAVKEKLASQDIPSNYNVALGDYLIMYLALADKSAADEALNQQTDEFIDDGNSRSYLRAWIYTRA